MTFNTAFERSHPPNTTINEKDKWTAKGIAYKYLDDTDSSRQLQSDITDALTTIRKEARAAAFKEVLAAIPQVGVTFPEGYEEWIDAPSYRENVIAAIEAAANDEEGGENEHRT